MIGYVLHFVAGYLIGVLIGRWLQSMKTARVAREDSANVDAGSAVGGSSGCNPVGGRVQLLQGVAPRAVDARAVVHPVHGIVPTVPQERSTDPAGELPRCPGCFSPDPADYVVDPVLGGFCVACGCTDRAR